MPDIWLPDNVRAEEQVDRTIGKAHFLGQALQAEDPDLYLVWGHENADDERLIPGRWHIMVDNARRGGPNTFIPIVGDDDEYREPSWTDIDRLRSRDLHRPEVADEMMARSRKRHEARLKTTELHKEQRADVIAEDYRAAKRVSGDGGLERRRWGAGGNL